MADRAEQNRVETPELIQAIFRKRFARPQVAIAAPIQVCELESDVFLFGNGLQHFHAFRCNFGAGSVAAYNRDLSYV
jgi:hypothetical protein